MRRSAEKVGFSTVDSIRRVKKVTASNCKNAYPSIQTLKRNCQKSGGRAVRMRNTKSARRTRPAAMRVRSRAAGSICGSVFTATGSRKAVRLSKPMIAKAPNKGNPTKRYCGRKRHHGQRCCKTP